jgi:hypothetical protein
MSIGLGIDF